MNASANDCRHDSASGVDTAPFGPDKLWRCDHCGLTWLQGPEDASRVDVAAALNYWRTQFQASRAAFDAAWSLITEAYGSEGQYYGYTPDVEKVLDEAVRLGLGGAQKLRETFRPGQDSWRPWEGQYDADGNETGYVPRPSPDCAAKNHKACTGDTWSDVLDMVMACNCGCHVQAGAS